MLKGDRWQTIKPIIITPQTTTSSDQVKPSDIKKLVKK